MEQDEEMEEVQQQPLQLQSLQQQPCLRQLARQPLQHEYNIISMIQDTESKSDNELERYKDENEDTVQWRKNRRRSM